MKTLTVTEVARNFSAVMDGLETEQEEVVLVRNHRAIARLVPEPPEMTALDVLGDLYRTLDDPTGDALTAAVAKARKGKRGTLKEAPRPMGYLIDTSLWIAIERGRLGAGDIHAITQQSPVYLSPVNLAEVRFGIGLMTDAKTRQRALAMWRRMRRKPLLRITGDTAEVFGNLAAALLKSGRGSDFRVQDLWLAAQAVQHDLTVLTANAKDFKDIPGLKWAAIKVPR